MILGPKSDEAFLTCGHCPLVSDWAMTQEEFDPLNVAQNLVNVS